MTDPALSSKDTGPWDLRDAVALLAATAARVGQAAVGEARPGPDERVRADRDRRAGERAVTRWANDNTADLRRLAGQITALTDLDEAAGEALARLHGALGDTDAAALPVLLATVRRHLSGHPGLTGEVDSVTARTEQIRNHRVNGPGHDLEG